MPCMPSKAQKAGFSGAFLVWPVTTYDQDTLTVPWIETDREVYQQCVVLHAGSQIVQ